MDAPPLAPEVRQDVPGAFHEAHGSDALTWTAEQPKRPGWWWVEIGAAKYVCELKIHTDGSLWVYNIWAYGAHVGAYAGCRWAGPLPEPQDAPDEESSPSIEAHTQNPAKPRSETK